MIPSIGFDMDQCLVEAFNLVPFILFFEVNFKVLLLEPGVQALIKKSRDIFYDLIASSEASHTNHVSNAHIFRPSLLKLFPALIKLKKEGKINHMFIYSNNGYLQILNAIDHILALILKKAPYSVNENDLILEDGRLHVLTPRIYIDSTCRVNTEPKIDRFREKSLAGIQACLNESISPSELWFFDDSMQHRDLITRLGEHYINVEAYESHMSNKTLIKFFIKSMPGEVFKPGTALYQTIIPLINKLFIFEQPTFYPTGKESQERLIEKFHEIMSKNAYFKPKNTSKKWSTEKINSDYNVVKKVLEYFSSDLGAHPRASIKRLRYKTTHTEKTPAGNTPFYGGRLTKGPNTSRRRRFRKLRTRRKSRK
jgi:hypothetical protein